MAKHERDITNISPPSAHRMPTVSASQALRDLSSQTHSRQLLTGLQRLDHLPLRRDPSGTQPDASSPRGVLSRGQITEIYGPPGVGASTFGMQVAAHALHAGDSVVWVDCGPALVGRRLLEILSGVIGPTDLPSSATAGELIGNLEHFSAPTLPHLLSLLLNPAPHFPPKGTSLIVIDSISALFSLAFPRVVSDTSRHGSTPHKKHDVSQWASGRRWAVISDFLSKLTKLAALRDLAILVINQTVTRIRPETGAMLAPAISSFAWESGIPNRIALYRDWAVVSPTAHAAREGHDQETLNRVRFAAVLRSRWPVLKGGANLPNAVPFVIEPQGLCGLDSEAIRPGSLHIVLRLPPRATTTVPIPTPNKLQPQPPPAPPSPGDHVASSPLVSQSAKRKRLEIPDSDSDVDVDVDVDVNEDDDVGARAIAEAGLGRHTDKYRDDEETELEVEVDGEDSYGWAETDDLSMAVATEDLIGPDNDKVEAKSAGQKPWGYGSVGSSVGASAGRT